MVCLQNLEIIPRRSRERNEIYEAQKASFPLCTLACHFFMGFPPVFLVETNSEIIK